VYNNEVVLLTKNESIVSISSILLLQTNLKEKKSENLRLKFWTLAASLL